MKKLGSLLLILSICWLTVGCDTGGTEAPAPEPAAPVEDDANGGDTGMDGGMETDGADAAPMTDADNG